ncbi:hypothetical protein M231_02301 [Tremella mesenterica]|uniref:Expansin-like EG45 domain-containing protein n=1 Tax=Tremella mesenterica TaxID=5217 RepID=A0A4Q1BR94_TREME|nr:uncharacterized protein TREMEDRAFT_72362 [Tremella mesenterica DSM 1558]EIW66519.1 hypothetical protein TREMEDRAFT_72362 [Tremella mesenterica DSM 1558]RXK40468.1 hypothetical protein M231_02301 [Tremella mesenterica]
MLIRSLFAILPLLPLSLASHQNPRHPKRSHHGLQLLDRDADLTPRNVSLLEERGQTFYGTGTYFFVGLGACGQYSNDNDWMVALNSLSYGGGYPGPQCFKYICIEANGQTRCGIEILDECPTCYNAGDLDLSPGLFQQYANTDAGTIQMTWWYQDDGPTSSNTPTPTSTWQPPTSTSTWQAPTTSSTTTWSPSPSSTTSTTPTSTTWSSSTTAPPSTITSSTSSYSSSSSSNSTNPYAIINNVSDTSSSVSASASASASSSTDGDTGETPQITYEVQGNLLLINGLVANVGGLMVAAAGGV